MEKSALDGGSLLALGIEVKRKQAIASANYVSSQLLFVWREDAYAVSAARNAHVPLLRIGCGANRRVAEKDVIDRLAL